MNIAEARKAYFKDPSPVNKLRVAQAVHIATQGIMFECQRVVKGERPVFSELQLQLVSFYLATVLAEVRNYCTVVVGTNTIH
jgi:hypothetical protein